MLAHIPLIAEVSFILPAKQDFQTPDHSYSAQRYRLDALDHLQVAYFMPGAPSLTRRLRQGLAIRRMKPTRPDSKPGGAEN